MIKHFALLTLLTLASLLSGRAATYYVTQSGAGTKDGSSASATLAVSDFNSNAKPIGGDTVILSGTFSSPVTPASDGKTGNPLVLDFRQATLSAGLSLNGRSNVTAQGGTTVGTISVSNGTNLTFDNWSYAGPNNGDVAFAVINGSSNITISNAKVTNCGYGFVGDKNHFINLIGCDVLTSTTTSDQVDIVHFGSATDVVIEKCKFVLRAPGNASVRHNDVIQTYQSGAAGGFPSQNWIIRYNWIENDNVQPASDGNSSWTMLEALVGKPAIKIYDNVFTAPSLTGGGGANNGIRDNKNPNAGDTHYLYNNTIIKRANPGNVIYWLAPGTAIWKNNILWSPAGQSSGNPNSTMSTTADYNFFFRNGTAFTGSHGSGTVDPNLKDPTNNDYSLAAGSPCIGKADNTIGAEFAFGIAPGSTWPNPTVVARTGAWDVGAFVYSGGGPGPSPTATPAPTATPVPTPTPANKFKTGDFITPTQTVNVRSSAAGPVLGTHIPGEIGQIAGGPVVASLNGAPVNWYEIGWTSDPTDGWVGDDNLILSTAPGPTPAPTPTPPGPTPTPAPTPCASFHSWLGKVNTEIATNCPSEAELQAWIAANPPKAD
jgi:hypothetical protein